jgi:hypothetical protein
MSANDSLEELAARLVHTRRPEDLFGTDPERAHAVYRRMARQVHPDRHPRASQRATQLFALLGTWWTNARQQLSQGTYGTCSRMTELLTLLTPSGHRLSVGEPWRVGDIADLYASLEGEIVKVCRDAGDNGLMRREAETLRHLAQAEHAEHFRLFMPQLVESFDIRQRGVVRVGNVLSCPRGLYSLREVLEAKGALDPRDLTWIYRRLLKVLAFAHQAGIIHGAVLPEHVLIHPDHGLTLVDWCYSVKIGSPLRAIPSAASGLYPEFVFARRAACPGLDLLMAAQCMVALLGGDPTTGVLPRSVHPRVQAFFGSWWRFGVNQVQDAHVLLDEFTALVDSLWPRQFRPFSMAPSAA